MPSKLFLAGLFARKHKLLLFPFLVHNFIGNTDIKSLKIVTLSTQNNLNIVYDIDNFINCYRIHYIVELSIKYSVISSISLFDGTAAKQIDTDGRPGPCLSQLSKSEMELRPTAFLYEAISDSTETPSLAPTV